MLKYVKDLWFHKSNDLISNHDANLEAVCEFNFLNEIFLMGSERNI